MTLRVHGHYNQHFTNADHPSRRMRMLNFTGAQIFCVLFKKLDHAGARGFKLFCRLRQSGKAANWPGAFR